MTVDAGHLSRPSSSALHDESFRVVACLGCPVLTEPLSFGSTLPVSLFVSRALKWRDPPQFLRMAVRLRLL